MQRTRKNAVAFSAYITEECLRLVEYLTVREELTQVVLLKFLTAFFIRKAVRNFINGDNHIDPRILIKERTNPKYIRRDALLCGYIDKTQKKILEEIAEEQGANFSQAFFQALVNYCALLITMDNSNIEITRK